MSDLFQLDVNLQLQGQHADIIINQYKYHVCHVCHVCHMYLKILKTLEIVYKTDRAPEHYHTHNVY